ncbi:glycosyltransferase [Rugamonas apoptosis]|uniref:Glycosyltransferase n=1 Tax=Rugamonas apoptosis TaxID=2758570 RepID=A0A7W2IMZ5_9BURK|nr:glycosyltransferase [Rugamonas apoptosis]MBA5690091.1 glycosyltransferase [Rugamonas apoptosis]
MNSSSPLRLLQFVPEPLPTFRADVAVLFGKYLPRLGVACHLVGPSNGKDAASAADGQVTRSPYHGSRLRRELAYLALCVRLLWRADKHNCDVIQVRDMAAIGLLAMLWARLKGIPFVYWMSFLMCDGRIGNARAQLQNGGGVRAYLVLWKGLAERWLLNRVVLPGASHVFVQSAAMLELMAAQGIARDKLSAVPMGVDTEVLGPHGVVARRLPGWDGLPVIAYLGTLDRPRCPHVLIDALLRVQRLHPAARLLLIGDASNRGDLDALLAYAAAAGVGASVHVTGWMAAREAWPLLAGADLAVSYVPRGALLDISSPTKILEYLALALPCVGNDNPDQMAVLDASQAGWLTASAVPDLADGMLRILADGAAARARAALGPAYIEQHRSYRVIAQQVASRYSQLVRGTVPAVPAERAS